MTDEQQVSGYQEKIDTIGKLYREFLREANQGEAGRGSKGHALKARKLSTQLANELKEYRRVSIANDKS